MILDEFDEKEFYIHSEQHQFSYSHCNTNVCPTSEALPMDIDFSRYSPGDVSRARSWPKVSLLTTAVTTIVMVMMKMLIDDDKDNDI